MLTDVLTKMGVEYVRIQITWKNGKKVPFGIPRDWKKINFNDPKME